MLEKEGAAGTVAAAAQAWRGVKQMHVQRRELLRQAQHILGKLGRLGRIEGLVCVGDVGKLVLELQSVCGITGKAYVVNDENPDAGTTPGFAAVLTRRSVSPVGEYHAFSYRKPALPAAIPDGSVGLVTMNQGLHHLPQAELMSFLADVFRVLRPGGLLIVREHDATEELKIMCDAAHWVFNAVTGVSPSEEANELRCFRSILEWRRVLQGAGFVDSLLYDVEPGDPTQDEMMCFYKPPFWETHPADAGCMRQKSKALVREDSGASVGGKSGSVQHFGKEHGLPGKVQSWLDSVPLATHAGALSMFEALLASLPGMENYMKAMTRNLPVPEQRQAQLIIGYGAPLLSDMVSKILKLLRKAHVTQGNNMTDLPLDEFFLALELFSKKPLEACSMCVRERARARARIKYMDVCLRIHTHTHTHTHRTSTPTPTSTRRQ